MADMLQMQNLLTPCVSDSETGSDEREEEEAPPAALSRTKSFSVSPKGAKTAKAPRKATAKAPRKAVGVNKKTPVKQTMRRPYKSMVQEKLVGKQEIVKSRVDIAKKRFEVLQTQLDRLNNEMALREVVVEGVEDSRASTTPV
jgi:hypothetical protein